LGRCWPALQVDHALAIETIMLTYEDTKQTNKFTWAPQLRQQPSQGQHEQFSSEAPNELSSGLVPRSYQMLQHLHAEGCEANSHARM